MSNGARRRFLGTLGGIVVGAGLIGNATRAADDVKGGAENAAKSRLSSIDLFALEWVDGPRFAPDGMKIVFERHGSDIMTDRFRCDLWLIGADGTGLEALTHDGESFAPTWSPDGRQIVYVSGAEGKPQLMARFVDSNRTAKLTNVQHAPVGATFSPDGRWLAFTMFVPTSTSPLAKMPSAPSGAAWGPSAKVMDDVTYRADGAGYLEDGDMQIFVLPIEGGTPRQVTSEPFDHQGPLSWTPDGKSILFSANRRDDADFMGNDSEICEVAIENGAIRELTNREGPDHSPALSPDGSKIAYLGFDDRMQGYQVTHLYVMDRASGRTQCVLPKFDLDVQSPQWSADGKRLFFRYAQQGNTKIGAFLVDAPVPTVTGLASDVGGTSWGRPYDSGAYEASARGDIAFTSSHPDHPADLAIVRNDGNPAVHRLTRFNDDLFATKALAACESVRFESPFDRRSIQGWILKRPGFDPSKKYPLVLEIHGGPFADYGDRFAAEFQLYAAAGYVVLYINPRGSTSYGEEFGNLIHHDYPNHDYDDLMAGVDALLGFGYIDPDNLFVTGGSGGGVLTAWIVGHTQRFKAAVSAKPVINWFSFVLTADGASEFIRYWFPGPPWDHAEHYMKRSPITYVGNVKTPTMLLTGEADYRTPISESEQFYEALKQRKIDTALVRIPEASHGMDARPTQLITKVEHILAWFEKYRTSK